MFKNGNQVPAHGNEKTAMQLLNELIDRIDELPENRPLYKDSGLWQIRSDDMTEIIFEQKATESFNQFIERVHSVQNIYSDAFD
jgi:hypothetical protein